MIISWRYGIKPPNRRFYLERCEALYKCLEHVEAMPPFLVADMCRFVLNRALGNEWKVLLWLLVVIANNHWRRFKEKLWESWHLYVRLRTQDEIIELIDQDLERMTGEDCREWPDVIGEEEQI